MCASHDGRKWCDIFQFKQLQPKLGPVHTWCPCLGTNMDVVQTHQCPELKMFITKLGKGINYLEIGGKFGIGASTACKKVNAAATDESLFRLVPVPGHGA